MANNNHPHEENPRETENFPRAFRQPSDNGWGEEKQPSQGSEGDAGKMSDDKELMDYWLQNERPAHVLDGAVNGAKDLAIGVALMPACLYEASVRLADDEPAEAAGMVLAAVVCPLVGAASAVGNVLVGAACTPVTVYHHGRHVIENQDPATYTGRPRDLVGHTICLKGALATVEVRQRRRHAATASPGWLHTAAEPTPTPPTPTPAPSHTTPKVGSAASRVNRGSTWFCM